MFPTYLLAFCCRMLPQDLPSLPLSPVLPDLHAALALHTRAILQAPPGSGKTTLVPLSLLDSDWLGTQRIVMLQPRRVAARGAAARLASLKGEPVGQTVGYRIRLESKVSAHTRLEILTEGLLTRRLQADPTLDGIGLILFDEIHERSLNADLALALCLEAQEALRPDLRLLAMSATLDTTRLRQVFGADTPVLTAKGRTFPIDIRYAERVDQRSPEAQAAAEIGTALEEDEGDILVFLPGAGAIHRVQALLADTLPAGVSIHPLYSAIGEAQQRAALAPTPAGQRKIILATTIAETSLTLPDVRVVVDSGLTRRPRFDAASGLSRLETGRVSKASAEQRAGRAGRVAPGVARRLWLRAAHGGLMAHDPPEILTADLCQLVLETGVWGAADPADLPWIDPPPGPAVAQARRTLHLLGALDDANRPTRLGKQLVALPVHPRLGAMLLRAGQVPDPAAVSLAALLASLVEEGDITTGRGQGWLAWDLAARLKALLGERVPGLSVDGRRLARVRQVAKTLLDRLPGMKPPPATPETAERWTGILTGFAWPDRLALVRSTPRPGRPWRYHYSGGHGGQLPAPALGEAEPPAILAVAVADSGTRDSQIRLAAALSTADLAAHFAPLRQEGLALHLDAEKQAVVARQVVRYGRATLESRPAPLPTGDPEAIQAALLAGLKDLGPKALPFTKATQRLAERVATAARLEGAAAPFPAADPSAAEDSAGGWPDLSPAALMGRLESWLAPWLSGLSTLEAVARLDLLSILRDGVLGWEKLRALDALLPPTLTVPSGSEIVVDYSDPQRAVLAVRLQEVFGWTQTPQIAGGRLPLVIHLLSPGFKPVQVTDDLTNFWRTHYREVRAELRGRYIKHYWPENPFTAEPIRGSRKRG